MTEDKLSWGERNRLYGLSSIPMVASFFLVLMYFAYLMRTNPLTTVWDYIFQVGMLFIFIPPTSAFLTFEIICARKTKKVFNVKRFVGRISLLVIVGLSLLGFLAGVIWSLSSIVGGYNAALLGIVFWSLGFFAVASRSRRFFSRLSEGEL